MEEDREMASSHPAETDTLLKKEVSSSKVQEYVVIAVVCLLKFGDCVELYLPGVITQQVSCDLGIGPLQEGILGITIFGGVMVTSFFAGPACEKFGRRRTILAAMYSCVISTVLCAVVPNYWTLLLCRLMVGLSTGIGLSSGGVYLGEMVKTQSLYKTGTYLTSIACAAGGGWIGILGYWFLEPLGWRWFVLCTSIPIFIIPILVFHFYLPESPYFGKQRGNQESSGIRRSSWRPIFKGLTPITFKFAMLFFICLFYGFGSILLLPSFIQSDNERRGIHSDTTDGCTAVFGNQFLVLALVSGGCNIIGRVIGQALHGRLSFRVIMVSGSLICVISYGCMLLTKNIMYLEILMGFAKFTFSATDNELMIHSYDPRVLGYESFATASAIIQGFAYFGAVLGNALAVFSPNMVSIIVCLILCASNILVTLSINEV